jgi:hypothetical protein
MGRDMGGGSTNDERRRDEHEAGARNGLSRRPQRDHAEHAEPDHDRIITWPCDEGSDGRLFGCFRRVLLVTSTDRLPAGVSEVLLDAFGEPGRQRFDDAVELGEMGLRDALAHQAPMLRGSREEMLVALESSDALADPGGGERCLGCRTA